MNLVLNSQVYKSHACKTAYRSIEWIQLQCSPGGDQSQTEEDKVWLRIRHQTTNLWGHTSAWLQKCVEEERKSLNRVPLILLCFSCVLVCFSNFQHLPARKLWSFCWLIIVCDLCYICCVHIVSGPLVNAISYCFKLIWLIAYLITSNFTLKIYYLLCCCNIVSNKWYYLLLFKLLHFHI